MDYNEKQFNELLKNFNLLCDIISQPKSDQKLVVDLTKIEEIINEKIPNTLKKNAPEDFYEVYTDFKAEYERFRDFIRYNELIGKNVVALGGGFSTGKSSFLNALMGQNPLPSNIDPSTSVPTYIVKGEDNQVMGMNVFDANVQMELKAIRKIAHNFGALDNEDNEQVTNAVTLGHVLESIFLSTKFQEYENLAFLDTPGYSKPDSKQYSAKTDEQIARRQLNSSNYILWFVQANAGTIIDEDINFIKSLREDIPKLIIVNKADVKPLEDLKEIIAKIRSTLTLKGIAYVDVLAFSDRLKEKNGEPLIFDDGLRAFIAADREKIKAQLEKWNQQVYESKFAISFKKLFTRCKDYYTEEIEKVSRQIERINTVRMKLLVSDVEEDILEPLNGMLRSAQKSKEELKEIKENLSKLKNEFFGEIKKVADIVNIEMPEPSEIDLILDKVQDPLQIIEAYKKEKGIKTDKTFVEILEEELDGIEPVLNKRVGGSEYRNELLQVLEENCCLKPEEIKIHNAYKNTKLYQRLLEEV